MVVRFARHAASAAATSCRTKSLGSSRRFRPSSLTAQWRPTSAARAGFERAMAAAAPTRRRHTRLFYGLNFRRYAWRVGRRRSNSIRISWVDLPQLAVVRVGGPGIACCRRDRQRPASHLERRPDRVLCRIDDRDRRAVQVRHPELAADPRRPERIRADADLRRRRRCRWDRAGRSAPPRSTQSPSADGVIQSAFATAIRFVRAVRLGRSGRRCLDRGRRSRSPEGSTRRRSASAPP